MGFLLFLRYVLSVIYSYPLFFGQFGLWYLDFAGMCKNFIQRLDLTVNAVGWDLTILYFVSCVTCLSVCLVDCPTYIAWHAKSCFLHDLCSLGSVLGWNLLSGNVKYVASLVLSAFFFLLFLWRRWFIYDSNENIEQARAVSTDGLRPSFLTINAVVYAIQVKFCSIISLLVLAKWTFWSLAPFIMEASFASWLEWYDYLDWLIYLFLLFLDLFIYFLFIRCKHFGINNYADGKFWKFFRELRAGYQTVYSCRIQ